MQRPKSVMIAGHRVKLVYADLQGEHFGFYIHDSRTIHLDKNLPTDQLLLTLRHEMVEAALLLSGVGFNERYEQEAVVRCLDEIFFPAWERVSKRLTSHP